MAIEEPSVVAAASNAAKMTRVKEGFMTSTTGPVMIGQIQAVDIEDPHGARLAILQAKDKLLAIANEQDPILVKFGGGAQDLQVKVLESITGPMVITELLVDTRDAMGANAVNTMAEAVAPAIEDLTGGRVFLRGRRACRRPRSWSWRPPAACSDSCTWPGPGTMAGLWPTLWPLYTDTTSKPTGGALGEPFPSTNFAG